MKSKIMTVPNWYPRIAPLLCNFRNSKNIRIRWFSLKIAASSCFCGSQAQSLIVQARTAFGAFDPSIILLLFCNLSIADVNDTLRMWCNFWIMCNHNNCYTFLVKTLKKFHNLCNRLGIKRTSRFIRKLNLGMIGNGSCNSYSLTLSTWQLCRFIIHTIF